MKVTEKLKKLIRHETSARTIGNLAEAEAFAAKIQELLDKHNLSFSDFDVENAQSTVNKSSQGLLALNQWQRIFINNLAHINGCRLVMRGVEITLVGNEIDREIVFELYRYFRDLGKEFADTSLKQWKITPEYKRKRKKIHHSKLYKTSYLFGFVHALLCRFREQHEAAKRASSNQTALIFIGNKLTEADNWIQKNLQTKDSNFRPVKWSKLKTDAYSKGVKAGESVALTTQTIS